MESLFAQHTSAFLKDHVLRPLATYVKTHSVDIANKDVDALIASFKEVLQLPATTNSLPSGLSSLAPPSLPMPAMNGMMYQAPQTQNTMAPPMINIPGLGAGLGGPAPPKVGRGKGKTAKVEPPWYTIEQFTQAIKGGQRICAYCQVRGQHKDHVCGAPAVNADTTADYTKWRCQADANKAGVLEKKLNTQMQGIVPATFPGYNVPPAMNKTAMPSQPQLPSFPSLPGLPTGVPGLPQFGINPPQYQQQQQQVQQAPPQPNSELNVRTAVGLKDQDDHKHYLIEDPRASTWLLQAPDMVVVGKFKYEVPVDHQFSPNYEQDLVPLSSDEAAMSLKEFGVPYVWWQTNQLPSVQSNGPLKPIQTLGGPQSGSSLPGLPGLPALQSLPAIPSLSALPTIG